MTANGDGRVGRLAGKRALVIGGGGRGIDASTARRFAHEGASVYVADLDEAGAQRVADELRSLGAATAASRVDIADESSVQGAVTDAVAALGGIDVLFTSVAGVSAGDGSVAEM